MRQERGGLGFKEWVEDGFLEGLWASLQLQKSGDPWKLCAVIVCLCMCRLVLRRGFSQSLDSQRGVCDF